MLPLRLRYRYVRLEGSFEPLIQVVVNVSPYPGRIVTHAFTRYNRRQTRANRRFVLS